MNHFPIVSHRRWHGPMVVLAVAGVCAALFTFTPGIAAWAQGAANIDDAARALMKLDEEWSAAANRRDVEKVASYYAEDGIAYPPNEPEAVGREAAKKVWAAALAEPSFTISWTATRAEVCKSGELGLTSGPYEASYNDADGKKVQEKGKFLCVWKKQSDGTWKAIHDMWNADAK